MDRCGQGRARGNRRARNRILNCFRSWSSRIALQNGAGFPNRPCLIKDQSQGGGRERDRVLRIIPPRTERSCLKQQHVVRCWKAAHHILPNHARLTFNELRPARSAVARTAVLKKGNHASHFETGPRRMDDAGPKIARAIIAFGSTALPIRRPYAQSKIGASLGYFWPLTNRGKRQPITVASSGPPDSWLHQ